MLIFISYKYDNHFRPHICICEYVCFYCFIVLLYAIMKVSNDIKPHPLNINEYIINDFHNPKCSATTIDVCVNDHVQS